jgi:hypothetical protein
MDTTNFHGLHVWSATEEGKIGNQVYCYTMMNLTPKDVDTLLNRVPDYWGHKYKARKVNIEELKDHGTWERVVNLDPSLEYMKDLKAIINHIKIWHKDD